MIFILLQSIIKGMWPDFVKIVMGRWDSVKWENLQSDAAGKGNWDKVRLFANFISPFVNIFIIFCLVYALEFFGWIPEGSTREILSFAFGTSAGAEQLPADQ